MLFFVDFEMLAINWTSFFLLGLFTGGKEPKNGHTTEEIAK